MSLDKKDRLIIAGQLRILEALHPKEAAHYRQCRIAVEEGYELHYSGLLEPIQDPMSMVDCREIQVVLEMHCQLKNALDRLGKIKGIKKGDVRFRGFHEGSESRQLGYARFVIDELGRYDELRDKKQKGDFASDTPMLPVYRRMIVNWRALDDRVRYKMDRAALHQVLDARGWNEDFDAED